MRALSRIINKAPPKNNGSLYVLPVLKAVWMESSESKHCTALEANPFSVGTAERSVRGRWDYSGGLPSACLWSLLVLYLTGGDQGFSRARASDVQVNSSCRLSPADTLPPSAELWALSLGTQICSSASRVLLLWFKDAWRS